MKNNNTGEKETMIKNLKGGFLAVLNIFSYSSFRGFPLVRPFQTKIEDPTSLNMLERNELSTIPEFLRFFFSLPLTKKRAEREHFLLQIISQME